MENANKEIKDSIEKILRKIRETRKQKGLSHESMAHELNMSASSYNKLERSETTLSLERLLKIKLILDLPFSDLFELKTSDIYNQDLKDNAIGHLDSNDNTIIYQQVENLYQDSREKSEKIENLYEERLKDKDVVIAQLQKIIDRISI